MRIGSCCARPREAGKTVAAATVPSRTRRESVTTCPSLLLASNDASQPKTTASRSFALHCNLVFLIKALLAAAMAHGPRMTAQSLGAGKGEILVCAQRGQQSAGVGASCRKEQCHAERNGAKMSATISVKFSATKPVGTKSIQASRGPRWPVQALPEAARISSGHPVTALTPRLDVVLGFKSWSYRHNCISFAGTEKPRTPVRKNVLQWHFPGAEKPYHTDSTKNQTTSISRVYPFLALILLWRS
jgi:hypothetical protein